MEKIELFNKEYHLACPYYERADNRIVEMYIRPEGYIAEGITQKIALIFILKGKISFSSGFAAEEMIDSDNMIVLPKHAEYTVRYVEESQLFLFRIEDSNELCLQLRENLLNFNFKAGENYDGMCLKINALIRTTLELFAENAGKGLRCTAYLHNILDQLLTMICAYYPPKEVSCFFAPVFFKDTTFKMSVTRHRNRVFNARELAKLCNMSYISFYRHFMNVFGISPKEWITEERKKKILKDLIEKGLSPKETSKNCGFSSREQFYKFCRKEFGRTAEEIQSGC